MLDVEHLEGEGMSYAPNQDENGDTPLVRWMKAGRPRPPLSEEVAQRCVEAIGRVMRDGNPAPAPMPTDGETANALHLAHFKSAYMARLAWQAPDGPGRGVVYFLECNGCMKIGFTEGHPLARMAALHSGCPFPLKLWAAAKGRLRDEQRLHKRFSDQRIHFEWFRLEADELGELREWILGRGGRVYV